MISHSKLEPGAIYFLLVHLFSYLVAFLGLAGLPVLKDNECKVFQTAFHHIPYRALNPHVAGVLYMVFLWIIFKIMSTPLPPAVCARFCQWVPLAVCNMFCNPCTTSTQVSAHCTSVPTSHATWHVSPTAEN